MTETKQIAVKRSSTMSWAVEIDGQYKGHVHKFIGGGYVRYCHDLWIARGARFNSLDRAVADLVKRAA